MVYVMDQSWLQDVLEVRDGKFGDQFLVYVFQAGSSGGYNESRDI
jgi:fumarate hydratase class II